MTTKIQTVVLGASGYVAGELLRLIAQHPILELAAAVSESRAGQPIHEEFPNLQSSFGEQTFVSHDRIAEFLRDDVALFSAAPHGASAALVANVLELAEKQKAQITIVDASADFRYDDADAYANVYGQPHGAPQLLDQFACALPEHLETNDKPHIGHPGCFATAMLVGAVPLLKLGLITPQINAVGITGSTGSGRAPTATTHHPVRHANLFAYKPLAHRHAPEVRGICEAVTGVKPQLNFVPHSGPFARGIHMTLQAQLNEEHSQQDILEALNSFYADKTFMRVTENPPRLKDVTGSNFCHLSAAVDGTNLVVFSVIDNLVKGAAGGAIQWMNRQLDLAEDAGLTMPGPGWM
ncbi:MAG: N-acetyl-gamma-glutamyl-phosphate reductase [Gammaproteobacteria bacterium]